jgi:multidrug efflux pump
MVIRSAGDHASVFEAMEALKKAARDSGKFAVVDSDLEFNNPTVTRCAWTAPRPTAWA